MSIEAESIRTKFEFTCWFGRGKQATVEPVTNSAQVTIPARVRDVGDVLWDVHEARASKYGFSLYFGTPADKDTAFRGVRPQLIVTKELGDHWQAIRATGFGVLFDLPASKNSLQRARRRLGLRYHHDAKAFWTAHIADLESLPLRELAAKYGVKPYTVAFWRRTLVGPRTKVAWWRTPEIRETLLSDKPLSEVSQELEITRHYACELRRRAKQELQRVS